MALKLPFSLIQFKELEFFDLIIYLKIRMTFKLPLSLFNFNGPEIFNYEFEGDVFSFINNLIIVLFINSLFGLVF